MYKLVTSLVRPHSAPVAFARCMASGRNRYIRGGSNKQDVSQETKQLLEHAKESDDLSWQLGYGVQEPLEMDLTTEERKRALQYKVKYKGWKVNDGEDKVKYYPHAGEEIPQDPPAPVLMVKKMKQLTGEPYWIKDYADQLGKIIAVCSTLSNCYLSGLGESEKLGKLCFLPNTPSVGLLLFKIKHIIKITPLTFPNGMPDDFNPDTHGYKLTPKGEFIVTDRPAESLDSIASRADWMKIDNSMITREARKHWDKPFASPLGNNNYHDDTSWIDAGKADSQFEKNKPKNKKWS